MKKLEILTLSILICLHETKWNSLSGISLHTWMSNHARASSNYLSCCPAQQRSAPYLFFFFLSLSFFPFIYSLDLGIERTPTDFVSKTGENKHQSKIILINQRDGTEIVLLSHFYFWLCIAVWPFSITFLSGCLFSFLYLCFSLRPCNTSHSSYANFLHSWQWRTRRNLQ